MTTTTSKPTTTFDIAEIDRILGRDALATLLSHRDLPEPTLTAPYIWVCGVEGKEWTAEVRVARLSDDLGLRWLWSPEAGEDAVEVIDVGDDIEPLITSTVEFAVAQGDGPSGDGRVTCNRSDVTYHGPTWADMEAIDA